MESVPGRESSLSPSPKQDTIGHPGALKPNQVSETSLYGVPIVSLVIDGKERLCLAQISNTLLKNYSYNEIHNRRVALGITCVQCTPVQLELLRRAGAMPISSRRCGMITKREAERLCKSFLGAHSPPKLPENFAFDVSHECAWGCRGSFIPARYNSSRAKCIKCGLCSMYFSPNKFIFHSHRTPESKYTQPDAANFNSWRRHLKLTEKKPSEDINHAWEDVKAMFNGGSRKRTLPAEGALKAHVSSALGRAASPEVANKRLRGLDDDRCAPNSNPTSASGARSYPLIPVPSKNFGVLQKIPPPLFPHPPYGFAGYGLCPKKSDGVPDVSKSNVPGVYWPSAKDAIYPAFPVFWPAAGGLPMPPYPKPLDVPGPDQSERGANTPKDHAGSSNIKDNDKPSEEPPHRKTTYISAFRPVVKDSESIAKLYGNRDVYAVRPGYLSPDFISETSSYRSASPDRDTPDDDDDDDPDVDVESNRGQEDEEPIREQLAPCSPAADSVHTASEEEEDTPSRDSSPLHQVHEKALEPPEPSSCSPRRPEGVRHVSQTPGNITPYREPKDKQADGSLRIDISLHEGDLENMAKEELQKQLVEQMELRKKLEREFQHLKDNFQDQMKRELSYREEMVQQLQIVRGSGEISRRVLTDGLVPPQKLTTPFITSPARC
uniref:SKI family transcriptional corepressor 1 homolog-B-like isoform X3 n=1 Tax=Doryrhamphus excisus TaxID=161450 RepID=UPI0025ADB088|nr:SKI family transcriptional corepressor 1 homolog-B-like isoform X3 [Doryrhamphus excisus]